MRAGLGTGLSKWVAGAAAATALAAPGAASAASTVINIDSASSTPASFTFQMGTNYRIEWIGTDGGLWDGYNLCPDGSCGTPGWRDNFIAREDGDPNISLIGLFSAGGPLTYGSAAAALAAYQAAPNITDIEMAPPFGPSNVVGVDLHPQPWIVVPDHTAKYFFIIGDPDRTDNVGGVSLRITSLVPEPATWTMLISGLGLLGAALRRSRLSPATSVVRD